MTGTLRFDLSGLARLCQWGLGLFVIAEIVNAANNLFVLNFLHRVEMGDVDFGAADRIDQITMGIGIIYSVLFFGTAILAAVWVYRASWNARQIQPVAGRITPGWAVGWFFVPFANLVMPYTALKQCWKSSHEPEGDIAGPVPGFFGWWWAAWLLSNVTGNVVMRMHTGAETVDDVRMAYIAELVTSPLPAVSAVLFAKVISGISKAQQGKTPALQEGIAG